MIAVWIVLALGVAGAVILLVGLWRRRAQGDMGVVSSQWIAEQRLTQGPARRR